MSNPPIPPGKCGTALRNASISLRSCFTSRTAISACNETPSAESSTSSWYPRTIPRLCSPRNRNDPVDSATPPSAASVAPEARAFTESAVNSALSIRSSSGFIPISLPGAVHLRQLATADLRRATARLSRHGLDFRGGGVIRWGKTDERSGCNRFPREGIIRNGQDSTRIRIRQGSRFDKDQDSTRIKIQQGSRFNKDQDSTRIRIHHRQDSTQEETCRGG